MDGLRLLRRLTQTPHATLLDAPLSARFPAVWAAVRDRSRPPATLRELLVDVAALPPSVQRALAPAVAAVEAELAPHPTVAWGCPPVGEPGWADWFEARGLGWLGRADPESWVAGFPVEQSTVQSALSARFPERQVRRRELQRTLLERLVGLLDEVLATPIPGPVPRATQAARAVQARLDDARRRGVRGWARAGAVRVAPDPALGEVVVTTGALPCFGTRAVHRYDGRTGALRRDGCEHAGPCGARLAADDALAAWLDSPEAEAFRAATEGPGWERALQELGGLAPGRPRVWLGRDPLRVRITDETGRELGPATAGARAELFDPDPVRVLRALAREGHVATDGERVRVREDDLPVALAPDGDGARLEVPELPEGPVLWLPSAPGELRWAAIEDVHRRLARWAGTVFPGPQLDGLAARLRTLPVRVEVPTGVLGERVPWSRRFVARLSFGPAGLRGELRVALPGGASEPVGSGEAVVAGEEGGRRVAVHRDLADEVRAFAALRGALGEGVGPDGRVGVDSLDAVVALAAALEARADVAVEWRAPLRRREVGPADVTVRLRPRGHWFAVEGEVGDDWLPLPLLLDAIREGRRAVSVRPGEIVTLSAPLFERLGRLAAWADGDAVGAVHAAALAADLRLRLPTEPEPDHVAPPAALAATLREYQAEGFAFLARRAAWAPGAVLADDMGLGKTVQALALVAHRGGATLVVAPTSVLPNWEAELAAFLPTARVHVHHGPRRALPEGDAVVLTTWDLLVRDVARLSAARWRTLVLDEAHAVKNPRTRRAEAAAAIPADFRVALTGTPVENHTGELWSLFSVVVPGLLPGEAAFRARYQAPIERGGDEGAAALARLRALVHPFLLRRTKAAVAPELPPRTEIVEHVVLGKADRAAYDRLRRAASAHGAPTDRVRLLLALTRLRQLCGDGRLLDPSAAPGAKAARLLELLQQCAAEGQRALVFSEFTSLLDLVEPAVGDAGLRTLRLDGETPLAERRRRVAAFQAGAADVFLLSRKAGGTGTNLTAATTVIHLDPWWNPAVEDQATDRAHRIGQRQPVTVIRLVARDTLEERVLRLHAEKRALVRDVLDGATGGPLSVEELRRLLAGDGEGTEPDVAAAGPA